MTHNSTIAVVNQNTLIILAAKSLRASSAIRHNQDTHTTIQLSDTLLITQRPEGKLCNSALGTKRRGRK